MSSSWQVKTHREFLESLIRVTSTIEVDVSDPESWGCVLAADIQARFDTPPFTNSAMDGFAVRHADLSSAPGCSVQLEVSGDVPAGDCASHLLEPGRALRIMTGALLPRGADTVVRVEDTDHLPGAPEAPRWVTIRAPFPVIGSNVRQRGEDHAVGSLVLASGTILEPAAVSALVSVGVPRVPVHRRPRIGILTTGRELVIPGETPVAGQIPDSNSVLLAGLAMAAGAEVVVTERVGDNPGHLRSTLAAWPQVDLVITAGGISAGAFEVVRQGLESEDVRFHHVAQQPGGPQGGGMVRLSGIDVPVVCLPGNPVGVFASFHLYVAGLIAMLAGRQDHSSPATLTVEAGEEWSSPSGKVQLCPVRRIGAVVHLIHRLGSKSHLVASLPRADGLVMVPIGTECVRIGDALEFIRTRGGNRGW